jgi:hypothetical protein
MKPDKDLTIATNQSAYRGQWPSDLHIGRLVWTWDSWESSFAALLGSGQTLTVRFSGGKGMLTRSCDVSVRLDEVFLGWFKDTNEIPSVTVRSAVGGLVAPITPMAKRIINLTKSAEKDQLKVFRARADASAQERLEQERAQKAEAIRKADGR